MLEIKKLFFRDNDPWGLGGNRKPNNDFDKFFNEGKKRFNHFFKNNQGNNFFKTFSSFFIVLILIWLVSGFYTIMEGEKAAVLRLGEFVRVASTGLNYHLPYPIESIFKQKVDRIEKEEVGFRSTGIIENNFIVNNKIQQRNISEESLMLTGDENIVDINFVVQWKISDIKNFLFNLVRPKDTVKSAAESAMREVIANTAIASALAEGKSDIERKTSDLLQSILDSYNSGVEIVSVQMLKADPPVEVIDAFRDVQTARADKEREINQAQAYQNDIIPRALGDAERKIQEAEAYKQEVIARSEGETSRFLAVYEQYKNAKEVTKQRIYVETMETLLKGMNKMILDPKISQSVLPYLPLSSLKKDDTKQD